MELLLDLLEAKVNSGIPTNAWWKNRVEWAIKCKRFADPGFEDSVVFSWEDLQVMRSKCRDRWMAQSGHMNQMLIEFCRLITLEPNLFKCCENPDMICVDGIVISIETRRIFASQLKHPWLLGPGKAKRATDRPLRHIWNGDKEDRTSMLIYAHTGVVEAEYQRLVQSTSTCPALRDALLEFSMFNGELYTCVPKLYFFFRSLGKDIMMASQFLPSCTWDSVTSFLNGYDDPAFGPLLETYSPLMSYLYYFGLEHLNDGIKFGIVKDLFRTIQVTAQRCYPVTDSPAVLPIHDLPIETQQQLPLYSNVFEESIDTGVFFPNMRYHSAIYRVPVSKEKDPGCLKYAKSNSRLGSGCMMYWCARHRICLGWEMLLEGESPKQVYHTLASRFPVMPKVVIYDNGCNLSEYFYNRCPNLCKDTLFLSDGFHFCHHINCAHCYDAKKFVRLLLGISTVTHEQKNQTLAKMKLTAPGMRYDSFMVLMSMILGSNLSLIISKNELRREKISY